MLFHKEKVYRLACLCFEDEFYSSCHQPAVQPHIHTLTKGVMLFSIFADLGNFDANFDPLHSSKLNESMCIL